MVFFTQGSVDFPRVDRGYMIPRDISRICDFTRGIDKIGKWDIPGIPRVNLGYLSQKSSKNMDSCILKAAPVIPMNELKSILAIILIDCFIQ